LTALSRCIIRITNFLQLEMKAGWGFEERGGERRREE
jgi:hypothetical protein